MFLTLSTCMCAFENMDMWHVHMVVWIIYMCACVIRNCETIGHLQSLNISLPNEYAVYTVYMHMCNTQKTNILISCPKQIQHKLKFLPGVLPRGGSISVHTHTYIYIYISVTGKSYIHQMVRIKIHRYHIIRTTLSDPTGMGQHLLIPYFKAFLLGHQQTFGHFHLPANWIQSVRTTGYQSLDIRHKLIQSSKPVTILDTKQNKTYFLGSNEIYHEHGHQTSNSQN